ncbi:MAG: rRNA maturation RNase YbeY [Saprospirales bacterium]|nr:MAG: rRNA maturation RNase YbeY [Saprospirales bacterium]
MSFFTEDIDFEKIDEEMTIQWLINVASIEGSTIDFINIIFCSDDYLHQLNLQYLEHDTLTDIITFPYEEGIQISGDVFISIDRIRDNSKALNIDFNEELDRVMVHGLLHLLGYRDKTEEDQKEMRTKEDFYLKMRVE